ncbi:MAG: hypothetical protein HGA31_03035 [Candidatus Moranbacteria bacterium]|nr:hypothetical protein [Candidatus Moranbacteria bacterium]
MKEIIEKFKEFCRAWKWEIGGAAILLFVVLINRFPKGYVISGEDTMQLINLSENYHSFLSEWLGRASLFYFPVYLLDKLGISPTWQLSWYLGQFLFGSYASFLVFVRLIFPKVRGVALAFGALFYAANIYTLYLFTSTWGYTHHPILYVFIPILTGLYAKSFLSPKNTYPGFFLLTISLASTSFGNEAFAVSLGIYLIALTVALIVFRVIKPSWRMVILISVFAVLGLALNAYWMLPAATQVGAGVAGVASSTDIDLPVWLRSTSNSIIDTLRMVQTFKVDFYYPYNFPYPALAWLKPMLIALTLVPIFAILSGAVALHGKRSEEGYARWYLAILSILVLFVVLVARVRAPFQFNDFIFQLPGLNVLRSYDKLSIVTPFLIVTLSFLALAGQQGKRYFKHLLAAAFLVVFLLGMPFFVGGIQTKLSAAFAGDSTKDYRKARYSFLVKMPKAYESLRKAFPNDPDGKVTTLPFAPASSVGRIDLAKWKANGPDVVQKLLPGWTYVEPNADYIPGLRFAQNLDDPNIDPEKLLDLYGLLGIRYVVYHRDVPVDRFQRAEESRMYMERAGLLTKLSETDSFFVYRLHDRFVFPYVYTGASGFPITEISSDVSSDIHELQRSASGLSYTKGNPMRVSIPVEDIPADASLYLNERYDDLWQAVYVAPDGSQRALPRNETVKFANAWKTGSGMSGGQVEIEYVPYHWLVIGLWISGGALALVIASLAYDKIREVIRLRK